MSSAGSGGGGSGGAPSVDVGLGGGGGGGGGDGFSAGGGLMSPSGMAPLDMSPPNYTARAFGVPPDMAVAELTDEAAGVRVCVAPNSGAELSSFQLRDSDGQWNELLYRGNDYNPVAEGDWQGRAPLLFPAVGRSFTPEQISAAGSSAPATCSYEWEGKEREIGVHGFLKDTTHEWELTDMRSSDDSSTAVCTLKSSSLSSEVKDSYPFDFEISVTYELSKGVLTSSTRIVAGEGTGEAGMPFSIGNHITLKFPLRPSGGSWDEGRLHGDVSQEANLTPLSLLSGETTDRSGLESKDGEPLSDPAYCNMVLVSKSATASLHVVDPGYADVAISHGETRLDAELAGEKYFVLWGDKERGFICPEPWLGGPNSLNTRKGLVTLKAGEEFTWSYSVSVERL